MSSHGGWDTVFRLFVGIPRTREEPVVSQQPALLRSAEDFSTKLEKWGKAASELVWEVSEMLRVMDELVEYHGGEDQGADLYLLALGYLGQKPDAELEASLRRLIREYCGELELQRLWRLLDRHRSRVSRTSASERVEKINSGFRRSYGSYQEALNTLSDFNREDKTEILKDAIRTEVCSEGAWLLLDKDLMNRVGSRIRRDATKAKEGSFNAAAHLHAERLVDAVGKLGQQGTKAAEDGGKRPLPPSGVRPFELQEFELREAVRLDVTALKTLVEEGGLQAYEARVYLDVWAERAELSGREAQMYELDLRTGFNTAAAAHEMGVPQRKARDYRSRYLGKFRRVAEL
jgi:hypothetical protein